MFQAAQGFRIGRPQVLAGLMLLGFLAQCLWAATSRQLSDLEIQYIASGHLSGMGQIYRANSPFTGWVAAAPGHIMAAARSVAPPSIRRALAIPRPWLLRLPFVVFGAWLGGALWWVARRLFDDAGGFVALALYCSSRAMVMISATVGPEIILAWSIFGLMYTAIGVAHTLRAPSRKWIPRVVILGLAIGFALSTALWSFTLVVMAFLFMCYLAPGRRRAVAMVLLGSAVVAAAVFWSLAGWAGSSAARSHAWLRPRITLELAGNLWFSLADGYVVTGLCLLALVVYASWRRARYFGNTAPLLTAVVAVFLFTLVPGIHIWSATLGLSFLFVFIGGVAADLLETSQRRLAASIFVVGILVRAILSLRTLAFWVHQNTL